MRNFSQADVMGLMKKSDLGKEYLDGRLKIDKKPRLDRAEESKSMDG
jgi:hypothetical protein